MLDDKFLNRVRRLIKSRFAEHGKSLSKKVSRIMRKQQIKKDLYSSHTENLVRAACEEEIRTKDKIVWDSIQEVHKAHGSSITETLRTDLKEEASRHIENAVREASELMAWRLSSMKPSVRLLDLDSTKREVIENISVKVDLYFDSLLCKPAETKQDITPNKWRKALTCIKKIPHWIYALIIFLAALLAIFNYLGFLNQFKAIICKILQLN